MKPINYISLITGNKYPYNEYINHGWGGLKDKYKDLPHNEYPYTLDYEKTIK